MPSEVINVLSLSGEEISVTRKFWGVTSYLVPPVLPTRYYLQLPAFANLKNIPPRMDYVSVTPYPIPLAISDGAHDDNDRTTKNANFYRAQISPVKRIAAAGDDARLTLEGLQAFFDGTNTSFPWNQIADLWTRLYEELTTGRECRAAPLVYDSIVAARTALYLKETKAPWQITSNWYQVLAAFARMNIDLSAANAMAPAFKNVMGKIPPMSFGYDNPLLFGKNDDIPIKDLNRIDQRERYTAHLAAAKQDALPRANAFLLACDEALYTLVFGREYFLNGDWSVLKSRLDNETYSTVVYAANLWLACGWDSYGAYNTFSAALSALRHYARNVGVSVETDFGTLAQDATRTMGNLKFALAAAQKKPGPPGSNPDQIQKENDQVQTLIDEANQKAEAEAIAQNLFLNAIQGYYDAGLAKAPFKDIAAAAGIPWPDLASLQLIAERPDERDAFWNRLVNEGQRIFGPEGDRTPQNWVATSAGWQYVGPVLEVVDTEIDNVVEEAAGIPKTVLVVGAVVMVGLFIAWRVR